MRYKQFKFLKRTNALLLSSAKLSQLNDVFGKLIMRRPDLLLNLRTLITLNPAFDNECLLTTLGWLNESPLDSIQLANATIDGDGLKLLPSNLRRLGLTGTKLTRSAFWEIQNFTKLETIMCDCVHAIREGGFNYVPPLESLTEVVFDGSGLDRPKGEDTFSPTIEHLVNFANLRELSLAATGLVSDDLTHLARCKSLEHLDLSRNPKIGPGLIKLFENNTLKSLNLSHCNLSIDALSKITDCANLEKLIIFGNGKLENSTLNLFANLKRLRKLKLSKGQFGHDSIAPFFQNSEFNEAAFVNCDLPKDFGKLLESSFLKRLVVKYSNFDDNALRSAIECLTLKYLDIRSTPAAWRKSAISAFRRERPECRLVTC